MRMRKGTPARLVELLVLVLRVRGVSLENEARDCGVEGAPSAGGMAPSGLADERRSE